MLNYSKPLRQRHGLSTAGFRFKLIADAVPSLDSHESGGEQGDQLLLSATLGEHLCLGQGEGAASLHHSPTGKDAFACGRSDKVDLELCGQNASVSRHEAECGVA